VSKAIALFEIEAYRLADGVLETLRFCDGIAWRTRPTETPANALYSPRIADTGWTRTDVFSAPGSYGRVTPGEVVLIDADGTLGTRLLGYSFGGRRITLRLGERGADYPSGYTVVLAGSLSGEPSYSMGRITFRPADLAGSMRKPFPVPVYAGDNVLPDGLNGVDDIKGRVKPIVFGLASNMTLICVNTSKLIYQVHTALPALTAAVTLSALRDAGVPLSAGGAYATVADLLDNAQAPAGGYYKVLATVADGTYVRIGMKPAGALTGDAAYGNAADRTHAQVWRRVLLCMGVDSADISAADVAALDAALPGEIEFMLDDERDADQVLNDLGDSAGAAWYGDDLGKWRITQWTAPVGTPVATLRELRTIDMDLADPVGNGDVAPAWRVVLDYGRNWTVQADADLGGDKTSPSDSVRAPGGRAGLAARAWLGQEMRSVPVDDAAIKTDYPPAIELRLTSLLADATQASNFATSRFGLYSVARQMTTLTQRLDATQIGTVRPGAVVMVYGDRWGYANGRLMRVAGALIDQAAKRAQLTVWG
jgi:hypothetical protein